GFRRRSEVEKQRKADGKLGLWWLTRMDVPHRVHELRVPLLFRIGREMPDIFVDGARDHVEIEPLRLAWALIHVKAQALGTGIGKPLVDGEAVAARLRDLLALLVEEQLVDEAFRLLRAEDAADVTGQAHRVDEVLPRHLVVDAERCPAHRPVGLPLQLAMTARDRNLREPSGRRLLVEDGP